MAACLNPLSLQGETAPLPCGKCPTCLARRVSHWSFRLQQQEKASSSAHFVTLTYAPANVPRSPNNYKTLRKTHLQLFFKRLRKRASKIPSPPIKYYACGEYGSTTKRPHYHLILFNAQPDDIDAAWQLGYTHYGTVTGASIGYTLKYINKKCNRFKQHRNDDRDPEFSLQSTRLGSTYLTPAVTKWHLADINKRMYVTTADGKKISMPRYYKNKLYNKTQLNGYADYIQSQQYIKESAYDINKIVNNRQILITQLQHAKAVHQLRIKQISNNKI